MDGSDKPQFAPEAMAAIWESKRRGHRQLAQQTFEEKIAALVRMQQRAHDIAIAVGRKPPLVWKLR